VSCCYNIDKCLSFVAHLLLIHARINLLWVVVKKHYVPIITFFVTSDLLLFSCKHGMVSPNII